MEAVQLMLALAPQHVNARDNVGYTPLHWAAGKGHVAIVQVRRFNMASTCGALEEGAQGGRQGGGFL